MPTKPNDIEPPIQPTWTPDRIEVWTKTQLANAYGKSVKWFVKRLKEHSIYTGRSRTLSPNQTRQFFDSFGAPAVKPSWKKHKN